MCSYFVLHYETDWKTASSSSRSITSNGPFPFKWTGPKNTHVNVIVLWPNLVACVCWILCKNLNEVNLLPCRCNSCWHSQQHNICPSQHWVVMLEVRPGPGAPGSYAFWTQECYVDLKAWWIWWADTLHRGKQIHHSPKYLLAVGGHKVGLQRTSSGWNQGCYQPFAVSSTFLAMLPSAVGLTKAPALLSRAAINFSWGNTAMRNQWLLPTGLQGTRTISCSKSFPCPLVRRSWKADFSNTSQGNTTTLNHLLWLLQECLDSYQLQSYWCNYLRLPHDCLSSRRDLYRHSIVAPNAIF